MALPRGMFRRGGKLWARKDVPKELRDIIGQTSLQQTLGTGELNRARVVFHDVMRRFEARIADAKDRLANEKPTRSNPYLFTIPSEQLGLNPEQVEAYARFEARKPENQALAATQRMERKLVEAGLVQAEKDPVSLDELFERWIKEKQPKLNSQNEFERAKNLFKTLNTDKPIAEYTPADVRKYKDRVLELTAPNGKPLTYSTRVKWFGSVKTLFSLADRNDLLTANPFAKIVLEKPRQARKAKREEWEIDDLNTLFASPVYTEHKRPRGGAGEAAYWLPVLALYHGHRAGELAQLDRADVLKKSGAWCLRVQESDEDDELARKSAKTRGSARIVPIHSAVFALGFLEYVNTVKGKKLWPKIETDSIGRWAGNFSKWFGRYRREMGLGGRWRDFHSFRHTWKTAARGARIPEDIHDEISGHENGSVGRGYGSVPVTVLKTEIEKIAFDVTIPKWKTY